MLSSMADDNNRIEVGFNLGYGATTTNTTALPLSGASPDSFNDNAGYSDDDTKSEQFSIDDELDKIRFSRYPTDLFTIATTTTPSLSQQLPDSTTNDNLTLPQIIVKLTAPNNLDYTFLSDFFLSYRNFSTSTEVCDLIFARLSWAIHKVQRDYGASTSTGQRDETGRDIIVRTFVVLRHWILNFFADDFVTNVDLRLKMAEKVNELYEYPLCQIDGNIRRVFDQLKRCWSRECSMYWNIPEITNGKSKISPGGPFTRLSLNDEDAANRRNTVLQFYSGPIDPVLLTAPETTTPQHPTAGFLIRGGIQLSNNVEVKIQIPPTPVQDFPLPLTLGWSTSIDGAQQPSTAAAKVAKPKKSLKQLIASWTGGDTHIFGTVVHALIKKGPEKDEGKNSGDGEHVADDDNDNDNEATKPTIDILSARVVEELDRILKQQQLERMDRGLTAKGGLPTPAGEISEFQFRLGSRASLASTITRRSVAVIDDFSFEDDSMPRITGHTRSRSEEVTLKSSEWNLKVDVPEWSSAALNTAQEWTDTLDKDSIKDWTSSVVSKSKHSSLTPRLKKKPHRISMIDNLGVQGSVKLPAKKPDEDTGHAYVFDSPRGLGTANYNLSNLSFDQVSNFSGTLSLRSSRPVSIISGIQSVRKSYMSYDSELSACDSITPRYQYEDADAALKRRKNVGDLRRAALAATSMISMFSMRTQSTFDRLSVYGATAPNVLIPYSGVDSAVAARLAAIPDDTPDDDAIAAALRKLEGRYEKASKAGLESVEFKDSDSIKLRHADGDLSDPVTPTSLPDDLDIIEDSRVLGLSFTSELDSQLYNDAFTATTSTNTTATTPELEQLNIPRGLDTPETASSGDDNTTLKGGSLKSISTTTPADTPQLGMFGSGDEDLLSVHMSSPQGTHVPLILDYSSSCLADQFTLIERDALAQVDWKELIELRWNGHLEPIQSWLSFLVERDVRGVEVVISRFNLMVNWVKSELLLTWSQQDRVSALSRFIHIAHQCRKLQNYATLMQITLALCSTEIQRLTQTWAALSKEDMKVFQQLERLISPLGNFKCLRNELKALDGSRGCIPFVGIYLSDLSINDKLPTYMPDHQRINFKKYRTAASIVKSLVQCIQWSGDYVIDTDINQDLLSKCLYVHSLTMEEMEQCFMYMHDP